MRRSIFLLSLLLGNFSIFAQIDGSLICINGLTVTLEPDEFGGCSTEVFAYELEGAPCVCPGPIRYAIYRAEEVAFNPNFVPEFTETRESLHYCGYDDPTPVVFVYSRDSLGVLRSCETYILPQSACGQDDQPPSIDYTATGTVQTADGDYFHQLTVELLGRDSLLSTTNLEGRFVFDDLLCYDVFKLAPTHDIDLINGVTTLDLIQISKHILGVELIDDPYSLIAADVNNSGTISSLDLVHLRRVILGLEDSFPNNTSWRFIPADYEFWDDSNPWFPAPWPEYIDQRMPAASILEMNFIGVKVGDVNHSAVVD